MKELTGTSWMLHGESGWPLWLLLPMLAQVKRNDVALRSSHEDGSAGALMTTEYTSLVVLTDSTSPTDPPGSIVVPTPCIST